MPVMGASLWAPLGTGRLERVHLLPRSCAELLSGEHTLRSPKLLTCVQDRVLLRAPGSPPAPGLLAAAWILRDRAAEDLQAGLSPGQTLLTAAGGVRHSRVSSVLPSRPPHTPEGRCGQPRSSPRRCSKAPAGLRAARSAGPAALPRPPLSRAPGDFPRRKQHGQPPKPVPFQSTSVCLSVCERSRQEPQPEGQRDAACGAGGALGRRCGYAGEGARGCPPAGDGRGDSGQHARRGLAVLPPPPPPRCAGARTPLCSGSTVTPCVGDKDCRSPQPRQSPGVAAAGGGGLEPGWGS